MTAPLLSVRGLSLDTPGGRPLLSELSLQIAPREKAALVGRNGVGKSSLLRVLAGEACPTAGVVRRSGTRVLVSQQPVEATGQLSPGQAQRRRLEAALAAAPDLLLLDEPGHDLDSDGIEWLTRRLRHWQGGLLVVSHERRLLRAFEDFFVIAESGSRHVHGSFETLRADLDHHADAEQAKYVRTLNDLVKRERTHSQTQQRRERKKNLGRIREVRRCTPRSLLNGKKSYAQESQGRRNKIQQARLDGARAWARSTRRALAINLHPPTTSTLPGSRHSSRCSAHGPADFSSSAMTKRSSAPSASTDGSRFQPAAKCKTQDDPSTEPFGAGVETNSEMTTGRSSSDTASGYRCGGCRARRTCRVAVPTSHRERRLGWSKPGR